MTTDVLKKHKVNHVALVIDKSGSMHKHESTVIRVVDEFVKGLKEESDALGHETRISLYAFDHNVECLVWDMDVKALPSMKGVYSVQTGATSLIEASVLSLEDLKSEVSEKYGEHSFLQVVWTDGEENASGCSESGHMHTSPYGGVQDRQQLNRWLSRIQTVMGGLPDHWTSAILVPSSLAKRTAQSYGFPAGNIATWDADTAKGVEEAIGTVKAAATSFLRGREAGVRGTKSLFVVGQDIDISTVKAVLKPLVRGSYEIYDVETAEDGMEIRDFVEKHTEKPYRPRSAYYELGVRVSVQSNKDVLVYDKKTRKVYGGEDARELLFGPDGRTNGTLSVKAGFNPDLKVFVMSGSYNRKLKKNTKLLVKL